MARSSHDLLMRKGDPSLKYFLREVLGEGSYGTVYRGVSISSKEEFAIKILPFDVDGESLITVAKEIGILKNLRSPYVVSFHDSYIFNNEMWIIMECCHGGSLIDLMEITSFQVSFKFFDCGYIPYVEEPLPSAHANFKTVRHTLLGGGNSSGYGVLLLGAVLSALKEMHP